MHGEMRASVGVLFAVAACFAPTYQEGAPCGGGKICPGGQTCQLSTLTCVRNADDAPDAAPVTCPPGYELIGDSCYDADECAAGTHDCGADAACTNAPGSFTCACNPGFTGDGRTCARICSRVLIYDDCTATPNCNSIPDPLLADNAARQLGIEVLYGGIADEEAFQDLFDAGGFDVVVLESARANIQQDTATRMAAWIATGGRTIVSYWDLGNGSTGQTLRNALGVSTVGSLNGPRNVFRDPAAPVDLMAGLDSPLPFKDVVVDDGDQLAVMAGAGYLGARFNSATGTGALAVTRSDRAVTFGFLPVGLVFQGPRDGNGDGTPDAQQLYVNVLRFLCGF
jgi:hypothetical protein